MNFKVVHLAAGLGTVVVFLGTGLYMRMNFPQLYEDNEVIRYLFRANHVYILFSGLLNVLLGLYVSFSEHRWRQIAQRSGSFLVLLSIPFFLWAFVVEPPTASPYQLLTLVGTFLPIIGVMFHLIGGFEARNKPNMIIDQKDRTS